jgi:hypothetical protein
MLGLLLMVGCCTPVPEQAGAPLILLPDKHGTNLVSKPAGPTLHLNYGRGESPGNPVAEFMYFVPLISLEPVSVVKSPGNTQRVRMLPARRSFTSKSFLVACEFEFAGEGDQQNVFDHTDKVRQHDRELKAGGSLDHQLGFISIEGAGSVGIEVEGTMAGHVPTVTEVRLRFNGRGRPSPVAIGLYDIQYLDGAFRLRNESVARVNTLIFRNKPGPPKMDITVASVKRKAAGDGFWQNLVGGLKATTANLFLKPIAVEPAGNEAMLNFGLALVSESPAFAFPRARNLKTAGTEPLCGAMAANSPEPEP